MANASIKIRMHGILDDYVASRLSAMQADDHLKQLIHAFAKIGTRQVEASRRLSGRLVRADANKGEIYGIEKPPAVVTEFRSFIAGLPE